MLKMKKVLIPVSGMTRTLVFAICLLIPLSSLSAAQWGDQNWNSQTLPDTRDSISGEVRTFDDRPIQNVQVRLQSLSDGTILSTFTDAAGTFRFAGVPNGSYTLTAFEGLHEASEQLNIMGGRTPIKLTMAANGQSRADGESTISLAQLSAPDKARSALQKAVEALNKNKLGDADRYVNKALAAYPRYAEALTVRGVITMQEDHPQQACEYLQKAIEYDPNYGRAYIFLGSAYNRLAQFDDAARMLDRGIAIAPTSWQGYYELSKTSLGKGNFAAALRLVEKAFSLIPKKFPPLHLVRAYAFFGLENKPAATSEFKTFLKEEPTGPAALKARQFLEKLEASSAGQ